MGRTTKKGIWSYTADGFAAVAVLNNSNIYAVMLSEMVSNIFKEGMWFKALTPYMLILTNNDAVQVGNMLTLNGVTRAFVGVVSGRMAINSLGVQTVWIITGFIGLGSILINVVCLCKGSIPAAYFLNFAWAVYNGLWNSCLETSWARSIVRSKREDVNGARQITNKVTTSLGPLFSAAIFLYCGNTWDIELVQHVMLFGTMMTVFTVLLCFCFSSAQEVEQDLPLRDVERLVFPDATAPSGWKEFACSALTIKSFEKEDSGCVKLTYPVGHDGDDDKWDSRLRILTKDFTETPFILVKQYHAAFQGIPADQRTCILCFQDLSRPPERVELKGIEIFLSQANASSVNRSVSKIHFSLDPPLQCLHKKLSLRRILKLLILGKGSFWRRWAEEGRKEPVPASLQQALLAETASDAEGLTIANSLMEATKRPSLKLGKEPRPNIMGANIIVICDVLNALGAGFSLKFMDLFLKVDYGVSPAAIFLVAFLQNIFGAWLTPYAKALLATMRARGYRAKLGVVLLWSLALFFLGLICIPGMPLWVVVVSIVMMQSLNSCTRAYNRAQLINYLPREKIVNYMTWDALNKANQGGVAIFGAQVVEIAGYRGCFMGTFMILLLRTLIYLAFTLRKGTMYRGSASLTTSERSADEVSTEEMNEKENIKGLDGDLESQLFLPGDALAVAAEGREGEDEDIQGLPMESFFGEPPPDASAAPGTPGRRGPEGDAPPR